jgi:ABC-type microcin C transport system duplicated ATPase subunit YejF
MAVAARRRAVERKSEGDEAVASAAARLRRRGRSLAGVGESSGGGTTASANAALVKLLTPEPKVKMEAPVGTKT